jgi:invasion protein IalB
LTLKSGEPRGAAPDIGHARYRIIKRKSDQTTILTRQAGERRFAGGSTKEELHLMNYRNASAPARLVDRTLAAIGKTVGQTAIVTIALALSGGSFAIAQQAPAPAAPAAAAPAAAAPAPKPKPPAAKPKPPAAKPGAPAAQTAPADTQPAPAQAEGQGGDQQVQLIYSPWTKFCLKGQDAAAKQVCFTGKDARIESGMPVVAAVLIEPDNEPKKILRVTLPLGMQLVHGTRVIIDQNQPMTAPYVICFTNGCMADYETTPDMIGKMKKGQGLVVQAINSTGQPISLQLPLADFAKAYDGPPTDPKVFEEQQKKLQEELQRRADEARKKLEQQQGQPQSSTAPPAPAPQAGKQ